MTDNSGGQQADVAGDASTRPPDESGEAAAPGDLLSRAELEAHVPIGPGVTVETSPADRAVLTTSFRHAYASAKQAGPEMRRQLLREAERFDDDAMRRAVLTVCMDEGLFDICREWLETYGGGVAVPRSLRDAPASMADELRQPSDTSSPHYGRRFDVVMRWVCQAQGNTADRHRAHVAYEREKHRHPNLRDYKLVAELVAVIGWPLPDTPPAEVLQALDRPGIDLIGVINRERDRPTRMIRRDLIAALEKLLQDRARG